MKLLKTLSALLALLLLSGCGAEQKSEDYAAEEPPVQAIESSEEAPVPDNEDYETWGLADFPQRFTAEAPTQRSEYIILASSEWENTVTCLKGAQEGPTVYFVCGLHGDEKAGWIAGTLLKEADISAGTIYILAPANTYGAKHDQRNTKSDRNANRYFPGDPNGYDAEQIDYAIYQDIIDKAPALVMDLHEADAKPVGRDNLGNSIICEDVSLMPDLVWDIMTTAEENGLCGGLTIYGTPPEGSINRTVTRELGIPTITVETSRAELLGQRVDKQLELTEYVLRHEGLIR